MERQRLLASSSTGSVSAAWTKLWRLKLPPKVLHFLWRLCSGILATKQNLLHRFSVSNHNCPLCACALETDTHLFVDCEFTREVWMEAGIDIHTLVSHATYWLGLFSLDWCDSGSYVEIPIGKIAMLMWSVWNARNAMVFTRKSTPLSIIISQAWSLLKDFRRAASDEADQGSYAESAQSVVQFWQKPTTTLHKINIDGAYKGGERWFRLGST